jgi:FkbM family methyltransferase
MRRYLVRKLPYYMRSSLALTAALSPGSRLPLLRRRDEMVLTFRKGLRFEVPELIDLLILKETLLDDVYELSQVSNQARLIVDVGAGIGDFAIQAASMFPQAWVIACEPNPESYSVLERNVRRNGLSNVDPRCVAVGSRSTYVLGRRRWSAESSTVTAEGLSVEVPAVPLYDLVADRVVDLLKIDCEGAELDVLESLDGSFDRVRRIAVEYHDHLSGTAGSRVEQLLRAQGFLVSRKPDRYDRRIGYIHATARDSGDPQEIEGHSH